MAKRKETVEIEKKLHDMCRKRRIYGCEEVTIGFFGNGHGNEIVDYCTMDSKGVLRCYEIKVTLADLKSKAKKSWYGHYNYLFVTSELWRKIQGDLEKYIPEYVGVAIPCLTSWSDGVEIVRNAKKQDILNEQESMMKESMVRSMYYKMSKYRDASNVEHVSELSRNLKKCEENNKRYYKENEKLRLVIGKAERILRRYYDKDIDLQEICEKVSEGKVFLPEDVTLVLNERGKEYNKMITICGGSSVW